MDLLDILLAGVGVQIILAAVWCGIFAIRN